MIQNFTAADIIRSIEAFLLLTLILFVPGYVIGWLSNVFRFRERRFALQAVLSTPLAVAVVPILIFLVGRYPKALWTLLGASWLGFAFLSLQIWKRRRQIRAHGVPRGVWIGSALVLFWAFLAIGSLVDLQFKDRLYFSSTAFDYSTRTAFAAAAARSIPPMNPFFAGNSPAFLRYHYFWMMVCSLATHLGNVSPRQALFGGTVWAGIALMSLIVISLKFFMHAGEHLARKALIGCSLLLVTGLDLLPTAFLYVHLHIVHADMEWWDEQITSWVDALLWTPHHVMSFVACMIGLLVLRQRASTRVQRVFSILIAGLAFASAAGLSVLVCFSFAFFVVLWLPFAAYRRWWEDVTGLLVAGAVALFVALPYLSILMGPSSTGPSSNGSGSDVHFVALAIRDFPMKGDLAYFDLYAIIQMVVGPFFILLLLLPVSYFFELGFYFIAGALRIRGIRNGSVRMTLEEATGWMMVGASFLIGSFLRSTTLGSNDLGWRCFLQAQFMLLLWAAILVDDWWSSRRFAIGGSRAMAVSLVLLAAIGLAGTMYQVFMLRAYPIFHDEEKLTSEPVLGLDRDRRLGERTYALRSIYESLGAILPPDAIVQYNPDAPMVIPHQLYSGRGAAMGQQRCGIVFGGDFPRCESRMKSIEPLFGNPSQAEIAGLDSTCREYGINVMLVDDLDPVWRRPNSWVWTRKPLLTNEHVRAFFCGDRSQ